jgi:hypothetical protein
VVVVGLADRVLVVVALAVLAAQVPVLVDSAALVAASGLASVRAALAVARRPQLLVLGVLVPAQVVHVPAVLVARLPSSPWSSAATARTTT